MDHRAATTSCWLVSVTASDKILPKGWDAKAYRDFKLFLSASCFLLQKK